MDISTLQVNLDFVKSLYLLKEWKDEECRDTILKAIEECNEKLLDAFGESMHKLHKHEPSFEAVEKVAKKFPSTLSYIDENGRLPIQTALTKVDVVEYIPILAKEGMKQNVGGEDARGGLLSRHPDDIDNWNSLQCLSGCLPDDDENIEMLDMKSLNVFKELRRLGLLQKTDIREQQMLYCSCWNGIKLRFEYLVRWDPDALIEPIYENKPLLHSISNSEHRSILALKAGFEYHPNMGGLLFIKDDERTTGLDYMFNELGVEEVMSLLHDILSPNCDYPILHHVFIKAPQHINLFMRKFRWAYHLKDHNGRTLHQTILAAGPDIMNANDILLTTLTDNQIQTKDPNTTLYPFAAMAVGEHADLESTFYLLRRQPSVMDRHSRSESNSIRNRRRKKRKVEK